MAWPESTIRHWPEGGESPPRVGRSTRPVRTIPVDLQPGETARRPCPPTSGSLRVVTDVRENGPGRGQDVWGEPGQGLEDLLARWGSEQTGPYSRFSGRGTAEPVVTYGDDPLSGPLPGQHAASAAPSPGGATPRRHRHAAPDDEPTPAVRSGPRRDPGETRSRPSRSASPPSVPDAAPG